ncbi:hypothetical protein [Oricola cellulosilytica]|uniref:Uncharacterized protein n=1 Tax=Oricola cellulosilytica TaxID=1429082 RepID=A0A4V2MNW2_9HYPH|nr:hypothetical protein [Oricola cellulosilytica]TCD14967.1 hypothetical protein E0D97_05280 [Oricola cellulosilytica]
MKRMTRMLTAALMATTVVAAPAIADSNSKLKLGAEAGASTDILPKKGNKKAGASADAGLDVAGQGVSVGVEGSANASKSGTKGNMSGGMSTDMKTTGSINSANNQGEIVSLIRSNKKATADLSAVTAINDVAVVRIDSASDASMKAIDNAIRDNQAQIDELRTSIEANAELASKLEAEGVDLSSVVAARTDVDGKLTVYVQ